MEQEKYITNLARRAVKEYIIKGKELKIEENELPDILKKKAGVFVTLKKNGNLRGCMGTFKAVQKNAAYEIISNAVTAAENDPRFPVLKKEELENIEISVDILAKAEKINDKSQLNPREYGILVEGGAHSHQSGLLLPNLAGIDTVDKQLRTAKKKAGLAANEKVDIYRFKVSRFKENE